MKKSLLFVLLGAISLSMVGCSPEQMNTEELIKMQETLNEYANQIDDVEEYVGEIQESAQEGIDSVNSLMDWYNNEAWQGNPYISTPISEEEVENLIEIGAEEASSYIDPSATYGVLSDDEINSFTEYFNSESVYGFIMSTYDKPEDCNMAMAFANGAGLAEKLTSSEKKKYELDEYESRIVKDDVDEILMKNLAIDSSKLSTPIEFAEIDDTECMCIEEYDLTPLEFTCRGGFRYNDLYLVMLCTGDLGEPPFAVTIFNKKDDVINIQRNYYSEDMEGLEFDGTFLFDLYDMMLDSDLSAVMTLPGKNGEISLGSVFEEGVLLSGNNINKAVKLISDKSKKAKTYLQEFDGYEVYYSNEDPDNEGGILDDYIVSQIVVSSGDFTTAEGIGIGSTINDIQECYGVGIEIKLAGGKKQLMYQNGKYDIVFSLDKDGKVEGMSLFLTSSEDKATE